MDAWSIGSDSAHGAGASTDDGWIRVNRTILIVDDDPGIRRLIATTLEDVSGYRMTEAGDGEEAVEAARSARPSIVFLDIDMPRLNGIEACRRMRSEPGTAEATIVMLTGDSDDDAERDARAAGADLFLTKPFSPLHLLRLVDRLGHQPSA
jgi:CheY-like chemotaxis protein